MITGLWDYIFDDLLQLAVAISDAQMQNGCTLYIQTLFPSYRCDNFLHIYSRGERYPSALCG